MAASSFQSRDAVTKIRRDGTQALLDFLAETEPPSTTTGSITPNAVERSRRVDNGSFERRQYPAPLEVSTSTGLEGKRTITTNISPEDGRLQQEEQGQAPSGSVMQSSRPSSVGALKGFGEFAPSGQGSQRFQRFH